MTISVLMSTYRKEKAEYLDAALKSIWTDQVRKPNQIVLVEDGPLTPSLYGVIERWKDELGAVLNLVKNAENKGLASALNDGIKVVTGDLIARMDSDDISAPDRFLLQEKYMEEHGEVDILGGALKEFNDLGTLDKVRHYPMTNEDVRAMMHRMSPLAHPSVMFRRSFFEDGFNYSGRYRICEDVTMWFDAVCAGRVINNIPQVIVYFRRNDSMMNRRSREKAWNEFLAYNDGIYRLYGLFTTRYIFSFMRMAFRLMPVSIIKMIYNSAWLRNKMS